MRLSGLFILVLAIQSCETKDCCIPPPDNVLPLQVGNYWIMKDGSGVDAEGELKKYIDAEVLWGTRTYFRMIDYRTFPTGEAAYDTSYYRTDEKGFVYERKEDSGDENNLFRLHAAEGEQWVHGRDVTTLTMIGRYVWFDTGIDNCRFYSLDAPQILDDESTTVLAPEIGFVGIKTDISNLQTSEASVYGVIHHFE
jgi:hypothetical protein